MAQCQIIITIETEDDSFQSGQAYPQIEKIIENLLNEIKTRGIPVLHPEKIYFQGEIVGQIEYKEYEESIDMRPY